MALTSLLCLVCVRGESLGTDASADVELEELSPETLYRCVLWLD